MARTGFVREFFSSMEVKRLETELFNLRKSVSDDVKSARIAKNTILIATSNDAIVKNERAIIALASAVTNQGYAVEKLNCVARIRRKLLLFQSALS